MDADRFLKILGWYDEVHQVNPTHDPIPNNEGDKNPSDAEVAECLCLRCEKPLNRDQGEVKTVNIRYADKFTRSYFYRLHRQCFDSDEVVERPGTKCSGANDKAWAMIAEHAMESTVSI